MKCTGEYHEHTLCVNKHHIFLACHKFHCIYKISLEGKEIVKYVKYGIGFDKIIYPYACMCGGDDNLLIVDYCNHRLQLLHGEQWSEIELKPPSFYPKGAVYDGQALYVIDAYKSQLLKYETENEQ